MLVVIGTCFAPFDWLAHRPAWLNKKRRRPDGHRLCTGSAHEKASRTGLDECSRGCSQREDLWAYGISAELHLARADPQALTRDQREHIGVHPRRRRVLAS